MSEITKIELREKLGNVSQLQELLFGEQTREYNQKLNSYCDRLDQLESNYQKLQLVMDERFKEFESKLVQQITLANNSLEKKVQYLNSSNKKDQEKIKEDLRFFSQQSSDNIDYLKESIRTQNINLKAEITQSKIAVDREIGLLKQQITDKLNSSLEELSTGKVSRDDLSEVLFELCLKLRQPNAVIEANELETTEENNVNQPVISHY